METVSRTWVWILFLGLLREYSQVSFISDLLSGIRESLLDLWTFLHNIWINWIMGTVNEIPHTEVPLSKWKLSSFSDKMAEDISFLSPGVRYLLVALGEDFQQMKQPPFPQTFLTKRRTFDWETIAAIFGDLNDGFSAHNKPETWYVSTIQKLWPAFAEAHQCIFQPDWQILNHIWDLCKWTRKEDEIKHYYECFIEASITTTEAILFITSILERSLGNVFLLKGYPVPSLLRDLLMTPELQSILGMVPMAFLQVLMGTPSALNLRNVAWHGFPRPDELHPQLVSALFLSTASIGELLMSNYVNVDSLPRRSQVSFEPELFSECFPLVESHCSEVLQALFQSQYVKSSHHIYWTHGLKYFMNAQYGACIMLLLPQLEHMLRCIFCHANGCPEKTLTAESTAFYVTFNEILSEYISLQDTKNINKVNCLLGDTLIEMLQDIFMHQAGPRIRDKLSHGECDLHSIPQILANHIICVALIITLKTSSEKTANESTVKLEEGFDLYVRNTSTEGIVKDLFSKILLAHDTYVSQFHPSTLLIRAIVPVLVSLDSWETYPCPDFSAEQDESIYCENSDVSLLEEKLMNVMSRNDISCEKIHEYVLSIKIKTLFRPRSETEIISVLKHIVDNMQFICKSVECHLKEKFQNLYQHKMRSRQRDTYKRMLSILPHLHKAIYCVAYIVIMWLPKINFVPFIPKEEHPKIMRIFKVILQFVENVASCATLEKNRWVEANALAKKFSQQIINIVGDDHFLLV